MKLLLAFVVSLVSNLPAGMNGANASGDLTLDVPELTVFTPEIVTHGNIDGIWFPVDQAAELLWIVEEQVPQLRLALAEQRNLQQAHELQIDLLNRSIGLERSINDSHEELIKTLRVAAQDKDDGILHSNVFWLAVGIVGGIASAVGMAAAINEVTN